MERKDKTCEQYTLSSYAQNAYFISFKQESYLKKCETKAFKKPNQEIDISIESTL